MTQRAGFSPLDALLLLLVLIWGSNFSIVKGALAEMPALGFNTLRVTIACLVLLTASRLAGEAAPARADWPRLAALGLLGHCGYQLAFVTGLARTTVANSSLILGCLPFAVLALNAIGRREDPAGGRQWGGAAIAFAGVCLVVGQGAGATRTTLAGDALILVSLWCWAWYTIGSRRLLTRYSPLQVTAWATLVGALGHAPFGLPDLVRLDWSAVSGRAWISMTASGVLALSVSHIIWYTGVQRIGSARTSVYSNLVPVAAIAVAAITLREPIGAARLAGAALVLAGLLLTRTVRPSVAAPVTTR